jgi:diamine N-acetyltransferase
MTPIELRDVTAATVRAICALEVGDDQKGFVAPNAVSIAQAYFEPSAVFRAVYADDVAVGFVMWRPWDQPGTAFLWRFMIDRAHQKRGYAKAALVLVLDELRSRGFGLVRTSVVLGDGGPLGFYLGMGFAETGESLPNGERVLSRAI